MINSRTIGGCPKGIPNGATDGFFDVALTEDDLADHQRLRDAWQRRASSILK
ncbi:hypothetical protein H257_17645 [Aphanomyces astaci]|uniref:Uncharacterized protein n=1 Tax=Aphanomyces astaci TaxID=112090 RepID=W4FG42_APHAT|nr:hypothetical protein H257_17645 [Aphanomyces astaci]ETV65703.1 hypothetical protein H257_17645 [Aphanomyces astaci]|eukprot:XP_009844810.1 hypothetical protein H257_17645 [Aphanomyces astaci]